MIKFKNFLILLLTLILIAMSVSVHAEIPQVINYQGRLTDLTGDPVPDSSYDITFSIYGAVTGGDVLWSSGAQSVTVTGGLFDYRLGSNVPFPGNLFVTPATNSCYVGIKVNDDPEIVPRTELTSVPYAFSVSSINGAQGGAIIGGIELTGDIVTEENHAFEISYPSNILFNSGHEYSSDFMIGTKFNYDADMGALRLGTAAEGYTLPSSDGSAGQVLSTDGHGQVSWVNNAIPTGVIVMWSGATGSIPAGWALCDGGSGTPDLENRFIVSVGGKYKVNDTGGTAAHTLTANEMPSHDHGGTASGSTSNNGDHDHTITGQESLGGIGGDYDYALFVRYNGTTHYGETMSDGSHDHTVTAIVNSEGGGQPHENRPPYYALAYIMKL